MRLLLLVAGICCVLAQIPSKAEPPPQLAQATAPSIELWEALCTGCHSLDANRVGPLHRGVYGRRAGSVAGFGYSAAVRNSGIVWSEGTLDQWLTDPQKLIPGQRMNFRVSDSQQRAAIIDFLKSNPSR